MGAIHHYISTNNTAFQDGTSFAMLHPVSVIIGDYYETFLLKPVQVILK